MNRSSDENPSVDNAADNSSVSPEHEFEAPFETASFSNIEDPSEFPYDGRLLWTTPRGDVRELSPSELGSGDTSELRSKEVSSPERDRSCDTCEATRSVKTVVREHTACGYVGMDGFVDTGSEGLLECPKCGVMDERGDQFTIIATVHSCVFCGRVLDRPLGESDGEP